MFRDIVLNDWPSAENCRTLRFMAKSGPRSQRADTAADVRQRLIDAAISVAGSDGFAQTSARAVATSCGVAPGVIYYHFGSMDGLLVAAHDALTVRRLERIRSAMTGGDRGDWVERLARVIEDELSHPDGGAAIELTIGATASVELTEAVRRNTDLSIALVTELAEEILGESPIGHIVPPAAIAEVAAAAFFGAEVMAQVGRPIDIRRVTAPLGVLLAAVDGADPSPITSSTS